MVTWYWIFFSYRLYFNTCCFSPPILGFIIKNCFLKLFLIVSKNI